MEKVYELIGLDCEHCAKKIADRLKTVAHVQKVEYTFGKESWKIIASKILTLDEVKKVVQAVKPTVQVIVAPAQVLSKDNHRNDEQIHEDTATADYGHSDGHEQAHSHADGHSHTGHGHSHAGHGHSHAGHGHSHAVMNNPFITWLNAHVVQRIVLASVGLVALIMLKPTGSVELIAYSLLYLFIGSDVVYTAVINILHGEVFDEMFLMSIATIGAFAIGEYPEAVVVMLFYQIGEYFQDKAVEKSRKSIADLMDIRPDYANLVVGDKIEKVSPEQIKREDLILVKPGERIPLDGVVVAGESLLDTSALTGESVPRKVVSDDEVLSGAINKNGVLTIRVEKEFGQSTVAKILNLVEKSATKKAATENFITKFSKYYTPVVVVAALALALIPPLLVGLDSFPVWLERALTFLVISCPCALVISVPLGFFGGLGLASKNGILIKGSNFLEALGALETVVFDKTGTLTKGNFAITHVEPKTGFSRDQLLEYATYAEWFSSHPIALAIKNEGIQVDERKIKDYEEIASHGVSLRIDGKGVSVGNDKLMQLQHIVFEPTIQSGTCVYVAVDKTFAGVIVIADEMKVDAKETIDGLRARNIATVMLTGDNEGTAAQVANELGIERYYAQLLPQDKVASFEHMLATKKGTVMFVGDGINDAPVLAQADLGVSMGGIGSDAAIEASDIVLMSDEPSKILSSIKISQKTKTIVWENIIFALAVKLVILLLGAFGFASMWAAVFADIGVSLIAIVNSMRIIYLKFE